MNDDEEFLPFEEEESDEDVQAAARDAQPDLADDDDDEAFLRGQTDAESDSGWDTGADTDAAFSGDDTDAAASGAEGEEEELFPEGADAMAMLAGMEGQRPEADTETLQPYEVLARQKRARRKQADSEHAQASGASARQDVFGAGADDIWNDEVAEHLGLTNGKKKKRGKSRRRPSKGKGSRTKPIPEDINRKLGEANLQYASGKHDEAIALLLEVIKAAPNLPDAYHTLGLLYEAQGDAPKSVNFFMISAHLSKDGEVWKRVATMSTELGYLRQAIYCLSAAINHDKNDLDARWDRAVLYSEVDEPRKALRSFKQLATARPGDPEVVKALARLYHQLGQADDAREVLHQQVHSYPDAVDLTHVNILAELYMEASEWKLAVDVIQHARLALCAQNDLPVELQVKAGICCAHLDSDPASEFGMQEAQRYFAALLREPVADTADMRLSVADELLLLGHAAEALALYKGVQELPDHNNASLWGKVADCNRVLGDEEEMISVYEAIIQDEQVPAWKQSQAALALAQLHLDSGAPQAAQHVLSMLHQPSEEPNDTSQQQDGHQAQALYQHADLLLQLHQQDAFLDLILPVVSSTVKAAEDAGEGQNQPEVAANVAPQVLKALRRRERLARHKKKPNSAEGNTIFKGYTARDRRTAHVREADEAAEALIAAGEAADATDAEAEGLPGLREGSELSSGMFKSDMEFQMLVQSGRLLLEQSRLAEARQLMQSCIRLFARRWLDKSRRDVLQLVLAEISMAEGDFTAAYEHLKPVCYRWPASLRVWNTYCRVSAGMGGMRHNAKFLLPLRSKHPTSLPLMLLAGHCLSQTTHAQAVGEFFQAYRLGPQQPLTLLCIGLAYIQQAMTRKVDDRNRTVLQAFAFLQEYARHREHEQEAAYNLGRAAHHLGMLHIAVQYYQKCLTSKESINNSGQAEHESRLSVGLRREAAFNLSLIYRGAGADKLAVQVLRQHVCI